MQERVVSRDLKMALEAEKRNGLEALGKLGKERRARAELEVQCSWRPCRGTWPVAMAKTSLSLREKLQFHTDSDNEELLNTIEAQKLSILSLEESLRAERENFSQLQHVLEVERRRGRRGGWAWRR